MPLPPVLTSQQHSAAVSLGRSRAGPRSGECSEAVACGIAWRRKGGGTRSAEPLPGRIVTRRETAWVLRHSALTSSSCAGSGDAMLSSGRCLWALRNQSVSLTQSRGTVVVERWWKVQLAAEGKEPYLHPRRHRIFRLVEDTKHKPKSKMELILMQTVEKLGGRGDTVFVSKAVGRNKLLAHGLAVYPSPENKKLFEEEKKRLSSGKPEERIQTRTGEMTLKYLQNSHLEVGINSTEAWELTKEIVCRHFQKNLGVVVPPHALTLPDERITQWGEHWCEVTVNGIDTVRIPMSVVKSAKPQTERHKPGADAAGSEDFHPPAA